MLLLLTESHRCCLYSLNCFKLRTFFNEIQCNSINYNENGSPNPADGIINTVYSAIE